MSKPLRRIIHPETKIIDVEKGIVEYIASDETVDSYREVIKAKGWRFNLFKKNAPFLDSHDYSTIDKLLGQVIDFRVRGKQLVERVKWAIDVEENEMARIGFKMTEAGYLKAVSVGFYPTKWIGPHSSERHEWMTELKELGLDEANAPRAIYQEQEQIELSACVIGANPNALAKAYKAEAISEEDLDNLSKAIERNLPAPDSPGLDPESRATRDRERETWLRDFNNLINK